MEVDMAPDEAANFVLERGRAVYAELQQAKAEIERLWAVNDRLRALLHEAPVIVIDERNAALRGEDELVKYARDIRAWHAAVKATLGSAR